MATQLGYTPPTPPDRGASDEVDDLVQALHDSGLLRALAGGARSYPRLLLPVIDALDADTLRSLISLGGAARDLDPETSERLAAGIRQARHDAARAAEAKPEGPRALFRRLRDPDTRRGLSAALAAAAAIGAALRAGDSRAG
ncbi:hypothetical protein BH11ACT8_BH11ACT8_28030 [soil metagenome]